MEDKTIRFIKGSDKNSVERFKRALNQTHKISEQNIPDDLKYLFKGKPKTDGELLYINALPQLELDDGKNAIAFVDDVSKIQTPLGLFFPSSDAIIYGKVLKAMLHSAPRVFAISICLIAFFVLLDLRNFRHTCIVMMSITMGLLWMFGIMWLTNTPLTFYNIVIIPTVLGMSIDNAIHIFHRYREYGPGSLRLVLQTSGKAALLASLTNASAFIGLLACAHKGLFSMGIIAVYGVVTCLISTLIFLPTFLHFLDRKVTLD